MNYTKSLFVLACTFGLSACGGGSGSGGLGSGNLVQQLAILQTNSDAYSTVTPQANLDGMNSSATYNGIVNVGTGSAGSLQGYFSPMSLTVDFRNTTTTDNVHGSASSFSEYSSGVLTPVGGSLTMSGNLTGAVDDGFGSALAGTAKGTVDGNAFDMTMSGSFRGDSAEAVNLWFSGSSQIGVGVGLR